MASPPPPYSPDPPSADATSPAAAASHSATPPANLNPENAVPSAERWSPDSPYLQVRSPLVATTTQFPPPPPSGQRLRSSSRNHAERILGAMNIRSRNTLPAQSAIEPRPHQTIQVFDQINTPPPAARRAVSANAIATYSSRLPYDSPQPADMIQAVPPPPPGPPPATSRSQSMSRATEVVYSPQSLMPTRRPAPGRGAVLEPVPPTPANWVDEDSQMSQSAWSTQRAQQQADSDAFQRDGSFESVDSAGETSVAQRNISGLVRSPHVRNISAKGLRERRSESQMGRRQNSGDMEPGSAVVEALSRPLQDIVTSESESLGNRRASSRLTPQSARFRGLDEALQSAGNEPLSGNLASGRTTPKSATFSPGIDRTYLTPRDTPRGQDSLHRRIVSGTLSGTPTSATHRPVSHILHLPNEDEVNIPVMPLSSEPTTPRTNARDTNSSSASQAMDRYRVFLEKEAAAETNSEKLHLFIEHMVAESKMRRELYADVFEEENLDPSELLEGMFEEAEHNAVDAHLAQLSTVASINVSRPSSAANSYSDLQSTSTRQTSIANSMDHPTLSINTAIPETRRGNFVPCLSPIASMSAVTRDETESRGRAPSRWWEGGSNPSTNGDGFKVLERTKRETKYMSAVIENEISPSIQISSKVPAYGENDYPPEKTDFQDHISYQKSPLPSRSTDPYDTPYTPDPRKLDVSRLITLPPPYPRHHPAVNNSHPDLADIRAAIRELIDSSEVDTAQQSYTTQITEKRMRANSFQEKQQAAYAAAIQRRMDSGTISQREFDAAEASLESTLGTSRLELAKADFSLYESLVISPSHTIYTTRISRATEALNALSTRLISDISTHSPNQPQEAGDEQPELLEKLTMLKWLFEARESLHRDLYALLSERNSRYKATVLLPLSSLEQAEERSSAESFFKTDSLDRALQFSTSALQRWTSFHSTIERHVTQGVGIILSAFWDIAPPLQALLQRVPAETRDLRKGRFDILIPKAEVEENPAYWEHPLRYLWSIVCHAEDSTRQFVEGQVSLWCLLQEVREGVVRARRSKETAQNVCERDNGQEGSTTDDDEEAIMQDEIRSGVEDLKEKVAAVEGQWVEGLGGEIGRVKDGLRTFLEETGGWDDELEGGE